MAAKGQNEKDSASYVTELNSNDVLLGRGAPILNSEGNIRFRKLIQDHKEDYTSTGRHAVKDEIARRILHTITALGGRFLRKADEDDDRVVHGIPSTVEEAWVSVSESVKLSKVKQALREHASRGGPSDTVKKRVRKSPSPDQSEPLVMPSTGANVATSMGRLGQVQEPFVSLQQHHLAAIYAQRTRQQQQYQSNVSLLDPIHRGQDSQLQLSLLQQQAEALGRQRLAAQVGLRGSLVNSLAPGSLLSQPLTGAVGTPTRASFPSLLSLQPGDTLQPFLEQYLEQQRKRAKTGSPKDASNEEAKT